ncbi:MAG: dihydrodipicolinate synthase family protein [Geminicoccaceae bacterium]
MGTAQPDDIRGVWSTILCRLDDDGAPDLSAIPEQVGAYAAARCAGVYSGGSASEVHCQTEHQFRNISKKVAETARRHQLPYQIGAAHPLPVGSLERVAFAATLDPLAIQVTLPDWTAIDFNGARRFIDRVAQAAAGVPLVLYNPAHAKTVLSPEKLLGLSESTPGLIGVKCGGGDAHWYRAMGPVFKRLSVFIPGHTYASGTARGAHGSYSNMACLSPRAAVAWGEMPAADAAGLEARIARFMAEAIAPMLERGLPGFACDKAMAAAGGWSRMTSRMMWPYSSATDAEVVRIARAARHHIPEFTSETSISARVSEPPSGHFRSAETRHTPISP